MKKHELLKFAYDNYPKGTQFKTLSNNPENAVSSGEFRIAENDFQGYWVSDVDTSWVICNHKNKWAEIVPQITEVEFEESPLITSEDGEPMPDGCEFYHVAIREDGTAELNTSLRFRDNRFILMKSSLVVTRPDKNKAFLSKEKAYEYIEANKPKPIVLNLYHGEKAILNKKSSEVFIYQNDDLLVKLSTGDINDLHILLKD